MITSYDKAEDECYEIMYILERVSKQYGRRKAVCDISFSVMEGQISAFLGPNGAGKSTTMKMLATLLKPTSGKILVEGYSMESQREQIKVVLVSFFRKMCLIMNLLYIKIYITGGDYIMRTDSRR